MPGTQSTRLYGNRYAESLCRHCSGLIRHERWCPTRNPQVAYAYQVLADPSRLSLRDQLILHALGVSWNELPIRQPVGKPAPAATAVGRS